MKKKFLGPKTDLMLTRMLWAVGGLLMGMVIISAVSQKRESIIGDISVNVEMLPDSSRLITEKDVITTLTRSIGRNIQGMPVGTLDLERVEERILEKDPFIADADVYMDARNVLNVDIRQREPLLRIIDANGKTYYIDKEGKHMPTSVNFTARVPVANGYIPPFTPEYLRKKRHTLKSLYYFAKKIREDEFMNALTEQIFVTQKREFIIVPKLGKQKIFFGRYENMDDKFKRLKIFYEEGIPYEGWQKYKTINLKFDGQVVCKK